MFSSIRRFITAATLVVLTGIMLLLAAVLPQFWFSFYPGFSAKVLSTIAVVTSVLPFSLWEILLGLLLCWVVVFLVLCIKRKRLLTFLSMLVQTVSILLFLFVGLWGLNHYGPRLSEKLNMRVEEYSESQLKEAASYYTAMASQYAPQIERNENGDAVLPSFEELSGQARQSYVSLSDTYPMFANPAPKVKKLLTGRAFSYMGLTGIFVPFTAEPCVNTESFGIDLPYTMCHELSHSTGIAAEDEANYCAFLACESSDSVLLRYSGYYSAFIYCYNALSKVDSVAASALWKGASEELSHDCGRANEHYEQYEGTVQEVTEQVNDAYLKAFSEEGGTQSYGMVADYLIAHYLTLKAQS